MRSFIKSLNEASITPNFGSGKYDLVWDTGQVIAEGLTVELAKKIAKSVFEKIDSIEVDEAKKTVVVDGRLKRDREVDAIISKMMV